MRRTPDFLEIYNSVVRSNVFLRPVNQVGDHLENRRILRALHERFRFAELEGIIDDDETLGALYLFDGTRFVKDKVLSLFDSSEYGFYNMFAALVEKISSFSKVDRKLFSESSFDSAFEARLVLELCNFVTFWYKDSSSLKLRPFGSDVYYSDNAYGVLNASVERLSLIAKSWSFGKHGWKGGKNAILLSRGSRVMRDLPLGHYIVGLSACLNLPDDRHAESGERGLVDDWLRQFDAFYPQYERLRAWYVSEKEKADDVGVRV